MTGKQPLYEKMGAFYLGKVYDLAADALTDEYYLYDASSAGFIRTTHAVRGWTLTISLLVKPCVGGRDCNSGIRTPIGSLV